jgi:hypothetical protein
MQGIGQEPNAPKHLPSRHRTGEQLAAGISLYVAAPSQQHWSLLSAQPALIPAENLQERAQTPALLFPQVVRLDTWRNDLEQT